MKKLFTLCIAMFCALAVNAQMSVTGNGFADNFDYPDGTVYGDTLTYDGIQAEWPDGAVIENGMLKWELEAEAEGAIGFWELSMDLSENTDVFFKYMFPADGEFGIWVEDATGGGGEVFPEDFQLGLSEALDYTIDLTDEAYAEVDLTQVTEIWVMSFSAAGGTFYLDNLRIGDGTFVGIKSNLTDRGLKVYPNPASDEFRIGADIKSLSVFNSIGQIVYSKENYLKGSSVDISDLGTGLYIVKADNRIHKLVVK